MEQIYVGVDVNAAQMQYAQLQYLMGVNERLRQELEAVRELKQREPVPVAKPKPVSPSEWSEFKRDGHRKATKAQSIGSYWDIKAMSDWFWEHGQYRNWALWRCGIAFGLRFSDLVSLRWRQLITSDGEFREYIYPIERKTQKRHTCLITEAVRETIQKYVEATHNPMNPDEFVFPGKTKGKGDGTAPLTTSQGCKILKAAADACHIAVHVSTHTMRKTMVNIACCVGGMTLDSSKYTLARGLLNHSSEMVSMTYLDRINPLLDSARMIVSDFILGKTDIKELNWDSNSPMADLCDRLEDIEKMLNERSGAIDCGQ